ncbi:hypothetical protein [Geodermatophilus sp. CPCC 205506]|uniref:hypothetical protein n=1 Tax=Geodermatophilus sp. CPCC 205506 TaxID=2936596 RepID=UPI003EEF4DD0
MSGAAEGRRRLRRAAARPVNAVAEWAFDRWMGVRTRMPLRQGTDPAPVSVGGDPQHYEPAPLLLWPSVHWAVPLERGATTFVDLGAGLGRAVILAAELGFRRVVGVELDERLAREGQENVRRWRAHRPSASRPGQEVVIVHGDAACYRLPDGPTLIWMFNAFGPSTLRHVLGQVCSRTRAARDELAIVYCNPVHEWVFDEFPRLTLHRRAKRWAVYRLDPAPPDTRRA